MCGIFCSYGKNSLAQTKHGIAALSHRGPDGRAIWTDDEKLLAIGFCRLAINGKTDGNIIQHYKNFVGVFNGEIYNHKDLATKLAIDEFDNSDTHIILPLFEKYGEALIDYLDGFYSGIIYDSSAKKLYWLCDSIGKKPLLFCASADNLFITSELKATPAIDSFALLPRGFGEIDFTNKVFLPLYFHKQFALPSDSFTWKKLFESAVAKRLFNNDTGRVGIFLSGGIDSAIIAALAQAHKNSIEIFYYSVADSSCPDYKYILAILDYLDIPKNRHKFISPPSVSEIENLICQTVRATESYNPSIISNGVGTLLLSQAAHNDGLKVVLTGDGADETFLGYWDLSPSDDWQGKKESCLADLAKTEMRRVDCTSMACSIEIRCPFLDRAIVSKSNTLGYGDFYGRSGNKIIRKAILKNTFADILPKVIINKEKLPFDRSSNIQEAVWRFCTQDKQSEQEKLQTIWQQHFDSICGKLVENKWFWSYPSFDKDIIYRGNKYGG